MTRVPGLSSALISISLLASGCSSDKKKDSEKAKDKAAPVETTKTVAKTAVTPVKIPALPEDAGEHTAKFRFAVSHGSTGTDTARSVAIDSAGDYLICGYFKGKGIFGSELTTEDSSAYLAKVSAKDGSVTWSVGLGGVSTDSAEALAVGPDDSAFVVGSLSGEFVVGDGVLQSAGADDIFVGKFGSDGHRVWVKRIGANDIDAAHSVAVDTSGGVYITGVFRSKVKFGEEEISSQGDADIYLTKLSPTGEFLWTKTFGAAGEDYGRDLAIDSKGNILLVAEISLGVDFGGGELSTTGNRDIVLAKLTADGEHLWSKSMGNSYDDLVISVAMDPSDNILFTGSFEDTVNFGGEDMVSKGRSDLYVAKFDANGEHVWSQSFGGKDKVWGNSIASDSFGNSYITGWYKAEITLGETTLKSKGDDDVLLFKLAANGSLLWAKSFGDTTLDMGKAVAVDKAGGVVLVGAYNKQIDLGGGSMTPVAGEDPKILKGDLFMASFEK